VATEKIQLPTPILGNVTTTGSNTINVSWIAVDNASGYVVEYATDHSFRDAKKVSTTNLSETLTGLTAYTAYYVRVTAIGVGIYSDSEFSGTQSAVTEKVQLPTPVFRNVSAASNTIAVTWNAVANANGYTIQYASNSSFTNAKTISVTTTSTTLTALTANTTYYVRIMATGSGTYSNSDAAVQYIKTKADNPIKPKVKVVKKATTITTLSLSLTTKAKNVGKNAEYVVSCTSHSMTPEQITVTGNKVVVTGLNSGTKYRFSVVAKNADGVSATAVFVTASTRKYVAVKGIKARAGLDNIQLSWKTSKVIETDGYVVEVYDANGINRIETATVTMTGTNALITGLSAKTKYTFVVKAIASKVNQESATAQVKSSTKYVAIKGIKARADLDSIELSWRASSTPKPAGITEVYEVAIYYGNHLIDTVNTTRTNVKIEGLSMATKYTFVVKAIAKNIATEQIFSESLSAKVSVSTAKYTAVKNVKAINKTDSAVSLTWNASKFIQTAGYEIVLLDNGIETPVEAVFTSATSATISGLDSSTTYSFLIRAVATINDVNVKSLRAKITVKTRA
jgi:chitodextrinase